MKKTDYNKGTPPIIRMVRLRPGGVIVGNFAAYSCSSQFITVAVMPNQQPHKIQLPAEIIAAVAQQQVQSESEPLPQAQLPFMGLRQQYTGLLAR